MKLRNKKTGEIVIADITRVVSGVDFDCGQTLAELNAEWEDCEEPKTYWFINSCGAVESRTENEQPAVTDMHKQFGNYFETKEEAELAVQKLKAYKRLKDKGLKFERPYTMHDHIKYDVDNITGELKVDRVLGEDREIRADLDLLFGGEE